MFKHTILKSGDVIPIFDSAAELARAYARNNLRLFLGLQCEFTHNEILLQNGYPIIIPDGLEKRSWDRELDGLLQDDKVATFLNSKDEITDIVSDTHTISKGEFDHWNNVLKRTGRDTIIHSFEYTSPEHNVVAYRGAISFRLWSPFKYEGKSSYYMTRYECYKYNLC
jgi:hypothetical protein